MKKVFFAVFLIFSNYASFTLYAKPINVVLLAPTSEKNQFWQNVNASMNAAAEQLQINLKIFYSDPEKIHVLKVLNKF